MTVSLKYKIMAAYSVLLKKASSTLLLGPCLWKTLFHSVSSFKHPVENCQLSTFLQLF